MKYGNHCNCNCKMCKTSKKILKIITELGNSKEVETVLLSLILAINFNETDKAIGFLETAKMNLLMNCFNPEEFMKFLKLQNQEEPDLEERL